ncbi:Protein MS5 [Arabidopsis suecica]|uniref:Protein MS5 n=1 Tax=Arabidopsis suecica TaxID=45249 RepID=A0A8T2CJI3_ARASU|nr:Protein MS5 [Arabidopsis suecica]
MDRTMISGSRDECLHAAWDYWRRLDESECFDIEGIEAPPGAIALIPYDCQLPNSFHPLPLWVKLYASAGLHRFNMLQGTNFKLGYVMKFNKRLALLSPYYITLLAHDSVSGSHQSFQVLVNEQSVGKLNIIIPIARPKGVTTNERLIPCDSFSVDDKLPQWPSHDSFNDTKRFYLVKESELQNNDWINLYLQLVLCAIQRVRISDSDLSKLKIVKAVIETKEDMVSPNERLNAKTAVVYITFKGLANARIAAGEHDERKAIIRRIFDEHTGHLSLLGDLIGEKRFVNIDPVTYFNSPAYLEDITHELPPDSPWMDILAGTGPWIR